MQKFTKLDDSKKFIPDPDLLKTYASFIIPLYINKLIKFEDSLLDEYLEMNKKSNKHSNIVCDLEIEAVKTIIDNPTTINGFNQLKKEVESGCPKLQNFLKKHLQNKDTFN
jgi:uncharacterized protein (DUF488 family)